MANISFKNINKIYDNKVQAVFDFNLDVKDKEFIVFVGPSGCGKSTTLRMLAGLEEITSGELYIDDLLVNDIVPMNRNIAMVFQNYALYPHLTVYKNMQFALKYRKHKVPALDENGNEVKAIDVKEIANLEKEIKKLEKLGGHEEKIEEIRNTISNLQSNPSTVYKMVHYTKEEMDARIQNAAKILGLTPYLTRKPKALSGGQRQRVALGRAIVRQPKVFLMDEPLSNLDAKLRVQMRSEIIKIHKKVGSTTIYVTHDQTEAMTMADRIVCMKDGYIQQIGTPSELYSTPENMFVAGFMGSPAMNFLYGKFDGNKFVLVKHIDEDDVVDSEDDSSEKEVSIELSKKQKDLLKEYVGKDLVLGIRPEDILLEKNDKHPNLSKPISIKCEISELLGHEYIVYGRLFSQKIVINTDPNNLIKHGDVRDYYFDFDKMTFFDLETTKRIR